MGKYFGTDGFRGEAGVGLTAEHAFKIGRYLGYHLRKEITAKEQKRARVVIGKDTRLSSYMLEYAIASGLASCGADVYLMHVTTTPSVSYVIKREGFDLGVMITASHNPFADNGRKVMDREGRKISDELAEHIEKYLDGEECHLTFAKGAEIGRIHDHYAGRNGYVGHLISTSSRTYKGMKIGIDAANGAAFSIARSVFAALGADVYTIGDEPDGMNVNYKCGSTTPEALARTVKENRLDVGFAFDGDADRCIAIDEGGRVVDGDGIMYILARQLKSKGELTGNKIIATVMSNGGLRSSLRPDGIDVEMTQVGDRFVYEKMLQTNAALGGEQSGHVIIRSLGMTGDGILTAILLCEEMLETGMSLSELSRGMIKHPQSHASIRVKDKKSAICDNDLKCLISALKERQGDDGRIIVRESGTEPVIRVMAESKTQNECDEAIAAIRSLLSKKEYVDEKQS